MSFHEFERITTGIIFGLIFSAPLYILMVNNATITIEKSYEYEFTQCENRLSECVESKTPSCSPCECKESIGYWVFYFIVLIVYLGTLFYNHKTSDLNEREQDIIKKEQKILSKVKKKV